MSEQVLTITTKLDTVQFTLPLLESKGYPSVSTSTCNGARKLFSKMQEDDIVLADLRLPDGDGRDRLEKRRKQGRNNPSIGMPD